MFSLAIVLVVVIAVSAFVFLQSPSADVGIGAPRLVLSTSQVAIGDSYFATASGFLPGEDVRFSWTGTSDGVMGVFPADSNGSSSPGPVFERDPPGIYTITVTGLTSGRTASAKIHVVIALRPPQLVLSTSQVAIGDSYFATASGFLPGEDVRFSWTGTSDGVMGVFLADSNGSSSPGPVFERDPPGIYTITVTGLTSGRTASAKLQVATAGN
jgi:hypothetical protein